ncbi:MAG: enoyl-CoA hydratase [Candidatus Rokubacteria bacterium]|nr:enoyl-CoA hydratase [Candidatus Rokubacteria bacterium]
MGFSTILVEKSEHISTLTLNRPEARNAVDLVMREEIVAALDEVEADELARVLIVTGAGEHFCAGGDVKSMQAKSHTAAEGRARVESLNRMVLRLTHFPKPTLAMVDGFAVGAGFNLALACDLIVASDRARFGQVFSKIGLVPDGGGTFFLPRLVGLPKAKELVFTAEIIDAEEAWRLGVVNRVVPGADLRQATLALAQRIAQGPPKVLALAKHLLNRSAEADLSEALDLEAFAQALALSSEDHREGLQAFFEKRPPRFTGR